MDQELLKNEIRGAIARGYCTDRNASKTLDEKLVFDMADEVLIFCDIFLVQEINELKRKLAIAEKYLKEIEDCEHCVKEK